MPDPLFNILPEFVPARSSTIHDEAVVALSGSLWREFSGEISGTAVETFAHRHSSAPLPDQSKYYRDLIPLAAPQSGEQYAFEVDLDACSGCKACVTACHNMNGLEEDEMWRSVGLLHGGTSQLPVVQHITTACHHCVEPACLEGCPVLAYDKDPVTGIVHHLDDQCIGCQYCILKCPYDVPKYSASKGIVRKCDMCQGRLAAGEAPACVQACPNQAIRISIVQTRDVIEQSEANLFLPGAPEPGYTIPSTIYKTARALPRNLLPADYYSVTPGHRHSALVGMLVLTQLSVGAFLMERMLPWLGGEASQAALAKLRFAQLVCALAAAVLGSLAAVFHLGRPFYAFRAIIGLRTSWLSREILAFGLFTGFGALYAIIAGLDLLASTPPSLLEHALGLAAAVFGIGGVFCSVMIYADTRRPYWNGPTTLTKFLLTTLILGGQAGLVTVLLAAAIGDGLPVRAALADPGRDLCWLVLGGLVAKLVVELSVLRHLTNRQTTPLKRSALLLTGELRTELNVRLIIGLFGGALIPIVFLIEPTIAPGDGYSTPFILIAATLGFLASFYGELAERSLFFTASVAPKMPGAPTS